ncbi:hypothetical protein [Mycobacterium pseudokansasii]|uniref:hypothetical protein n=1 Tax=Mycobacterium pseudokansasii TaxID=2341080 RepID=UPI0010A95F4F|nr:hypothetical protein [Mycobacterium pseudokansasii]
MNACGDGRIPRRQIERATPETNAASSIWLRRAAIRLHLRVGSEIRYQRVRINYALLQVLDGRAPRVEIGELPPRQGLASSRFGGAEDGLAVLLILGEKPTHTFTYLNYAMQTVSGRH